MKEQNGLILYPVYGNKYKCINKLYINFYILSNTDQTPTPTKFLKNLEEMGLFQELNKNPFDDSFKKAMDYNLEPVSVSHVSPESNKSTSL